MIIRSLKPEIKEMHRKNVYEGKFQNIKSSLLRQK